MPVVTHVQIQFVREAFSTVGASPHVQAVIGNTPEEMHQWRVSLKNVGDLRAPVGWLQVAATQAMLGHRRGAATQQTVRRRRKAPTFLSETRHSADDEVGRWAVGESKLNALLRGVAAANLIHRQSLGRVALQAYNVSRELVKEEAYAHLLPYVERMKRLPKYGRRKKAAAPPPAPKA